MINEVFSEKLCQLIVDGIIKGYKDYLDVRKRAKEELIVSTAYAWVKGNHIDNSVYDMCCKSGILDYKIDKAGYTWEYLQFTLEESGKKFLLFIKNSIMMHQTFNEKIDQRKKNNYLYEYAGINNRVFQSEDITKLKNEKVVQLELTFPEFEAIKSKVPMSAPEGYDAFYIITYEIDSQSKMIKNVSLTQPNQSDMSLYEIANLTPFIGKSEYKISESDLEDILNDKVPEGIYADDDQAFIYKVVDKDTDEKQNNREDTAN